MKFTNTLLATAVASVTVASSAMAQPAPVDLRAAASTQASVAVMFNARMINGSWRPATAVAGPAQLRIEYGQPYARGRKVIGDVVKLDSVWRTGANLPATLYTDLEVTIGNVTVPPGMYTIYTIPSANSWKLIITREFGQWGHEYKTGQDVGRTDMTVRNLSEPVDGFTIWLTPTRQEQTDKALPSGVLKMVWGNTEASVPWRVGK